MPQPPLEINDFSGGITDNYLDCRLNQYQKADNLLVKENKKFETVFGTRVYDSSYYQIPAGEQRVGSFTLFDDLFLMQSDRRIYYQSSGWQTLSGPTSNYPLAAGTTSNFPARAEWNKHLIFTTDAFGSPMKLYRDENSTLRVRNAGLPKITLTGCIELANQLKSKYNTHAASAVYHATGDSTNLVTSDDAYDLPSLLTLTTELITDYVAHNADANLAGAWVYHRGQQSGTPTLSSTTTPQTLSDAKTILDDLKSKYNAHDADATAHDSENNQQVSKVSGPTLSSAGGSGNTYIYSFCAYFEYYVGSTLFIDRGPTYEVTLSNVGTPASNTVTISNIPTIANGTTENYATSTIKWEIYRTTAGGTTRYFLKTVTNGTTSTTDTTADSTLDDNFQLYTAGGVKDNDPPPQAKFVVVCDDITWYGHVKEGTAVRKSRVRQSVKFDPDSCPESFYIDLEDEITGMGYVGVYPIIFCKRHVYRLEGFKDEFGRGTILKREISRTVGSVNHLSIVNTIEGCFFASDSGFYFTDGFKVTRVSQSFDATYKDLVSTSGQRSRIYGDYDIQNQRIYWCVTSGSSVTENDKMYVLDLKFGLRPVPGINEAVEATFTTVTPSSVTWKPCCIGFDASGEFVIGDSRGYIFKFDDNKFANPYIDTTTTPDNWKESAIIWDYRGPAFNFGSGHNRKQANWISCILENASNVTLMIRAKNDDSGVFVDTKELRYRGNMIWLDIDAPEWLPTPDGYPWLYFPLISEKRRLPAINTRFLYKQFQFTNADTIILRSDDYGTATTDGNAGTATLNTYPTFTLPTDLAEYFISFDSDSYATEYTITSSTTQVVTFSNPNLTAPSSASSKWVIRGVRKSERLNLVSYSVEWEMLTPSVKAWDGNTGGNA